MLAVAVLVGVVRVFFLQAGGVFEQQRRELLRRRRAVHGTVQSVACEARQVARVIDVRVREQEMIDARRIEGRAVPVAAAVVFNP